MNQNQNQQIVSAIDIGTTKIVAIIGKKNEKGNLEIIGIGNVPSKGVKRGVVQNIEEATNSIQQAVTAAEQMAGERITHAYVGIAGRHIKSIKNRGYKYIDPPEYEVTANDVTQLKNDMYKLNIEAGEEIIHVLPQSYIVDNETDIKNPVGMSGKRLEGNFHIIIGQILAANNIKKCINRTGIEINSMVLEPLASSKAVLTEDEKEVGVALIDIGGGTTDVAIYHDGVIIHTAVIPFGGDVITNDIKEGCCILGRLAELAKVKYGSALADTVSTDQVVTIPGLKGREAKEISFKSLAYIIQARMEEILGAAIFEIETSGYLEKLGAGIVLTGGGALLKNLPQLVAFRTGLDVRIGYPNEYLTSELDDKLNQPMFATSVGLLLTGYDDLAENQQVQVIPEVIAELPVEETETNIVEDHNETRRMVLESLDQDNKTKDKKEKKKKEKAPVEETEKTPRKGFKELLIGFFDEKDNQFKK